MKKSFLLLLILLGVSSFAQANTKLYSNIANSIDSLLADTVNEGDMTAEVSRIEGGPEMACKLDRYREQGKGIAKCDITFNIQSNHTDETQYCQQECFIIYVYDQQTFKIISSVESLELACIDNLSYGCD